MDGEVEYDPEWSTTHLVLNTIFSAVFAGAVAVLVTAVIERWVPQPLTTLTTLRGISCADQRVLSTGRHSRRHPGVRYYFYFYLIFINCFFNHFFGWLSAIHVQHSAGHDCADDGGRGDSSRHQLHQDRQCPLRHPARNVRTHQRTMAHDTHRTRTTAHIVAHGGHQLGAGRRRSSFSCCGESFLRTSRSRGTSSGG